MAPLDQRTNSLPVPPSILAKKILCLAFVPSPLDEASRIRLQGIHALTMMRILSKYIASGYRLVSLERGGAGFRLDIVLQNSQGKTRLIEAKCSKKIRESHRLQAAIYAMARPDLNEIVVSNGDDEEKLEPEYLAETIRRARATIELLKTDPLSAASSYTPHPDTCYICGNRACPYLPTSTNFR